MLSQPPKLPPSLLASALLSAEEAARRPVETAAELSSALLGASKQLRGYAVLPTEARRQSYMHLPPLRHRTYMHFGPPYPPIV